MKKPHVSTNGYIHKECLKTKIRAKSPIATKLSHFNCQGGPCSSGGPLGVTFWLKIENLCGNHILWAFCILLEKMFVSHFSDFVYWKLPIFWRFWWKPFFALIIKGYKQKLSKNLSHIGFRTYFINTFSWFGQNQVLVKIFRKLAIFSKQSLKND